MKLDLNQIDPSGSIGEAHENVEGDTRLGFMKKAGLGAGAVMSGGAIMAAFADSAMAAGAPPSSFGKGDIGILNYALTLEYLEAAFYNEVTANNLKLSPRSKIFLQTVTRDENKHVTFLRTALGSKAAKKPKFDFGSATKTPEAFQKDGADPREHGRPRLPRAGRQHQEQDVPGRGRLDPDDRGPSRGDHRRDQRAELEGHLARRCLRQAVHLQARAGAGQEHEVHPVGALAWAPR